MRTRTTDDIDVAAGMAGRLEQVEESARQALAQRNRLAGNEPAIEIAATEPVHLVPVPRQARMFKRHGEGHGAFSNVTLTGPVRVNEA